MFVSNAAKLLLVMLLSVSVFPLKGWSGGPAGIVLYTHSGGDVFLLLADHAEGSAEERGWAAFGGGAHDGETATETAARETEEETRGYYPQQQLLDGLAGQQPVKDGDFSCFFLEVEFVDADSITRHGASEKDEAYHERGPYAWVPYTALTAYLKADIDKERRYPVPAKLLPEGRQTDWFWPTWLNNLRQAVLLGALPWAAPVPP